MAEIVETCVKHSYEFVSGGGMYGAVGMKETAELEILFKKKWQYLSVVLKEVSMWIATPA